MDALTEKVSLETELAVDRGPHEPVKDQVVGRVGKGCIVDIGAIGAQGKDCQAEIQRK
jgi:hypothetical protein